MAVFVGCCPWGRTPSVKVAVCVVLLLWLLFDQYPVAWSVRKVRASGFGVVSVIP